MTHTPGPWTFYKTTHGAKVTDVQDVTVADVPQQPLDTWQATDTARLLAATPELLAALKELIAYEDDTPFHDIYGASVYAQANAAIAKATGD